MTKAKLEAKKFGRTPQSPLKVEWHVRRRPTLQTGDGTKGRRREEVRGRRAEDWEDAGRQAGRQQERLDGGEGDCAKMGEATGQGGGLPTLIRHASTHQPPNHQPNHRTTDIGR